MWPVNRLLNKAVARRSILASIVVISSVVLLWRAHDFFPLATALGPEQRARLGRGREPGSNGGDGRFGEEPATSDESEHQQPARASQEPTTLIPPKNKNRPDVAQPGGENSSDRRDTHAISSTADRDSPYAQMPKIVWMLWDKGFDQAPELQKKSLQTWIDMHEESEWEVRALNLSEGERLINRSAHYSDTFWQRKIVQHKADIIRIELIAQYGGVWVDATVRCNEPLDNWMPEVMSQHDFFVYKCLPDTCCWWTQDNWFIAGTNTSYMIHRWIKRVRDDIEEDLPRVEIYLWMQNSFKELLETDEHFKKEYDKMCTIDTCIPVCITRGDPPAHVNKMTAGECKQVKKDWIDSGYARMSGNSTTEGFPCRKREDCNSFVPETARPTEKPTTERTSTTTRGEIATATSL